MRIALMLSLLAALLLGGGCASREGYAKKRRAKLEAAYPLKVTTRSQVRSQWLGIPPELSQNRPENGWENCPLPPVRERCVAAEHQLGQRISSCDRYRDLDSPGAVGYCWFYFDESDHLLDVEWKYSSE